MALRPELRFALIAGASALIAGAAGVALWTAIRPRALPAPQGTLRCPSDPAPTASVRRGDFVILQLESADGSYHESTWATVLARTPDTLVAVLSGEQIAEGVRPLATDKHGFRLGEKMLVSPDCVWGVFHPTEMGDPDTGGTILCGPQIDELAQFLEDASLYAIAKGLTVEPGNRAEIVVASKASYKAWSERLWTRIVTMSPNGQVMTARIDDDPEFTDNHTLVRGSIVRYNRDCIIGAV